MYRQQAIWKESSHELNVDGADIAYNTRRKKKEKKKKSSPLAHHSPQAHDLHAGFQAISQHGAEAAAETAAPTLRLIRRRPGGGGGRTSSRLTPARRRARGHRPGEARGRLLVVDVVDNGGWVGRLRWRCGVARDVLMVGGGSSCRLVAALAGRLGGGLLFGWC